MELSPAAKSLIAKTSPAQPDDWLPLWMHARDTAGIMELLYRRWLPEAAKASLSAALSDREMLQLCIFLALTHDIGKSTPLFQSRISAMVPALYERLLEVGLSLHPSSECGKYTSRPPHAKAGEILLCHFGCPEEVAVIVGAHHGKPQAVMEDRDDERVAAFSAYYLNRQAKPAWDTVQREWVDYALSCAGFSSIEELPCPSIPAQLLLSGLLIMADWIASNTAYFPLIPLSDTGSETVYPARIDDAWKRLDLPLPWEPDNLWMYADLYHERFGFTPNSIQLSVAQIAGSVQTPGLMILEAPMGCGKTEVALTVAEIDANRGGQSGVFFALPTQATGNAIFTRLCAWAEQQARETKHAMELAHAQAELNDSYRELFHGDADISNDEDEGGLIVHSFFRGRKKALLSDFVVGTVDQLLMAALKQKHVMLRHLGLAGKVVVIDECHAYDAYMNRYLDRALQWLGAYGTPVIILSATLPAQRRAELIRAYQPQVGGTMPDWASSRAYPLLTWTDGATVCQQEIDDQTSSRTVFLSSLADGQMYQLLNEQLAEGGCAGIIVNTVQRAQAIAVELGEKFADAEVIVFHARFLMTDRAEIEKTVLQRLGKHSTPAQRHRLIVVGTQVLEQSLDLDFDLLLTDLCPMDLLLQRIGRLHRHVRWRPQALQEARCYIFGLVEEEFERGTQAIYGAYLLMRTRAFLPVELRLPGDISALVQNVYNEDIPLPVVPDGYEQEREKFDQRIKKQEAKADTFRLKDPVGGEFFNTIAGWLDTDVNVNDQRAEAAVRDGDPSLDVLVMQRRKDGSVGFLPWQYGGATVPTDHVPSRQEGEQIARQRLRLPRALCQPWLLEQTINALEAVSRTLPAWQESPWLKGEVFLLLDEDLAADLCGYHLYYRKETGLHMERGKD